MRSYAFLNAAKGRGLRNNSLREGIALPMQLLEAPKDLTLQPLTAARCNEVAGLPAVEKSVEFTTHLFI